MPIHNTTIHNARGILNEKTGEVEYRGDLDGITVEGRDLRGLSPYEKVKLKANRGQLYNAFPTPDPYSIDASNFGKSEEESNSTWETATQVAGALALIASMYGGHKAAPKINAQRSNIIGTARHLVRGQTPTTNPFHVGLMGNSIVARGVNNFINRFRPIDITSLSPEYGVQLYRRELDFNNKGFSYSFPLSTSRRNFERAPGGKEALHDLYMKSLYHYTDDLHKAYVDAVNHTANVKVTPESRTPVLYSSNNKGSLNHIKERLGEDYNALSEPIEKSFSGGALGYAFRGYPYAFADVTYNGNTRDWRNIYSTFIHELNHTYNEPVFRTNTQGFSKWDVDRKIIRDGLVKGGFLKDMSEHDIDIIVSHVQRMASAGLPIDSRYFENMGVYPDDAEFLGYYTSGEEMSSRGSETLFNKIFPNIIKSTDKSRLNGKVDDAMELRKRLFDKYPNLERLDRAVESADLSINRYRNQGRRKKK